MIYKQVFKTSDGAAKKARFLSAHNRNKAAWYFADVRFRDGVRDESAFDAAAWRRYTWRIERRPTVRALAAMADQRG